MSRRLAASLQKMFGLILISQETFPTLGGCLGMRFPQPWVCEVQEALRWPNTVLARALAIVIQRAHKYCIKTNMA